MPHRTLSALSSETADALGLPPLVDLTLRTHVLGQIGSPGFRLTHEWVKAGRKEIVNRTGAVLEAAGDGADGLRRVPRWMLEALDVADRFQAGTDLDEHWEALARFRRALEPGVRMDGKDTEARLGMTDFLSGLEVTLTDRLSISPRGEDQFAIIPFLGETVEAAEREGGQVSETEAELTEGRLRAFQDKAFARGARPAYKLGAQSYLVIDPSAAQIHQGDDGDAARGPGHPVRLCPQPPAADHGGGDGASAGQGQAGRALPRPGAGGDRTGGRTRLRGNRGLSSSGTENLHKN